MEILAKVTGTVQDVFTIGKSLAKVVTEEVGMLIEDRKRGDDSYYDDEDDFDEADVVDTKTVSDQLEKFEGKAKKLIKSTFAKFKVTKTGEQKELETRIAALEEKLSKLVEESLDALKKS